MKTQFEFLSKVKVNKCIKLRGSSLIYVVVRKNNKYVLLSDQQGLKTYFLYEKAKKMKIILV